MRIGRSPWICQCAKMIKFTVRRPLFLTPLHFTIPLSHFCSSCRSALQQAPCPQPYTWDNKICCVSLWAEGSGLTNLTIQRSNLAPNEKLKKLPTWRFNEAISHQMRSSRSTGQRNRKKIWSASPLVDHPGASRRHQHRNLLVVLSTVRSHWIDHKYHDGKRLQSRTT